MILSMFILQLLFLDLWSLFIVRFSARITICNSSAHCLLSVITWKKSPGKHRVWFWYLLRKMKHWIWWLIYYLFYGKNQQQVVHAQCVSLLPPAQLVSCDLPRQLTDDFLLSFFCPQSSKLNFFCTLQDFYLAFIFTRHTKCPFKAHVGYVNWTQTFPKRVLFFIWVLSIKRRCQPTILLRRK